MAHCSVTRQFRRTPACYRTPFSPSADRNKQAILDVLQGQLPSHGLALEIASGTGQHAAWFLAALPHWNWQATDFDANALPGIGQWLAQRTVTRAPPPVRLDVCDLQWPSQGAEFVRRFDLVYCANMLHIAPWPCCAALMQGCGRYLAAAGRLVLYGPYLETDVPTSAGNLAFDRDLRARNPAWGLRTLSTTFRRRRPKSDSGWCSAMRCRSII